MVDSHQLHVKRMVGEYKIHRFRNRIFQLKTEIFQKHPEVKVVPR